MVNVRIVKPKLAVKIYEYERGYVYRFGKIIKELGPGLHRVLPIADEVRIVDIRLESGEETFTVLTNDNFEVPINLKMVYGVSDPERFSQCGEGAIEDLMRSMLISQVRENVAKDYTMQDALNKRGEIKESIRNSLEDYGKRIGVEVRDIQLLDIGAPEVVKGLQKELYEAQRERIIEPIKAETEAATYKIGAKARIEIGKEKVGLLDNYLQTFSSFADRLKESYGPRQARDIIYIMFGKALGNDPFAAKIRKTLEAEGIAEGAEAAAEIVKTSPQATYLINSIKEFGSGVIVTSLEQLDKVLQSRYK